MKCERCGSQNMAIERDYCSIFCGCWKCYDCGYIGDKAECDDA